MVGINVEALTDRDFAIPYAVAGWTAVVILGLTMYLQPVGAGAGGEEALWFRVAGGWIALLMAALAWILVDEPLRLEMAVEEATAELQRSEARYRALYDHAPLAYATLDSQGRVRDVNEAFETMLGRLGRQLQGEHLEELLAGERGDLVRRFREDGRLDGEELALDTADGRVVWVHLTMRWADLDEVGPEILAMALDVTERKRAETKLENHAQELERSNEELERSAYAASHDLREPLGTIRGHLDLLDRRFGDELPEDAWSFVDEASSATDDMHALIHSLLEYGRMGTDETHSETVNLEEAWEDVARDLSLNADRSDVSVDVGDLPVVRGDPTQLRRLLQNLVSNAVKHGGPEPHVRVGGEETDEGWVLRVEDDGPGIPPEERDQVFEVFHRATDRPDEGGTGIGLAVCRRIADRHGGRIEVTDGELGGACFRLTLPSSPDAATRADGPRPAAANEANDEPAEGAET